MQVASAPAKLVSGGGEAPIEENPETKYCLADREPLPESALWKLQQCYYEALGESAWDSDVPSFASSNAKLARDYAKSIFHFIRDLFSPPATSRRDGWEPPAGPVLLVEAGAGHGRFTFLLLKHLAEYKEHFLPLGLPARPFVLFFTDVAESNIEVVRKHPDLAPFVAEGWLDFAVLDAGRPAAGAFRAIASQRSCWGEAAMSTATAIPIVLICNYLIDSVCAEALQFVDSPQAVRQGRLSVFSPREESVWHDPTLNARLSFKWDWEDDSELLARALATQSPSSNFSSSVTAGPGTLSVSEEGRLAVIRRYLDKGGDLTLVLPLGAFRLVESVVEVAGEQLLLLIGDKGHRDSVEFGGHRNPHIAVHGSFSFMVNFDALRIFFEHLGGFSEHTLYHDVFQVGVYSLGPRSGRASLLSALAEGPCDFGPASLMLWSKQLHRAALQVTHPQHITKGDDDAAVIAKAAMASLRYSGHDPELFWGFHDLFLSQCTSAQLNPRGSMDLATDLDAVYERHFQMGGVQSQSRSEDARRGRDLPSAIGEIFARMGRPTRAAHYFRQSIEDRGPRPEVFLNLSACLQASGNIAEAGQAAEEAVKLDPKSTEAGAQLQRLQLCSRSAGTVLIGAGHTTLESTVPMLLQDPRMTIKAVFALSEDESRALGAAVQNWAETLRSLGVPTPTHGGSSSDPIEVIWGAKGLQCIMQQSELQICVVDVNLKLLPGLLSKLWAVGKHVLSPSPLAADVASARSLLDSFHSICTPGKLSPDVAAPAWHALEAYRYEEAFVLAQQSLEKLGRPVSISIVSLATGADPNIKWPASLRSHAAAAPGVERLARDLLRLLDVVMRVTAYRLAAISVDQPEPMLDRGNAAADGEALAQSLIGHFVLRASDPHADGGARACTGTLLLRRPCNAQRSEIRVNCANGHLELHREVESAWTLTVTDERFMGGGPRGRQCLERSVPCVGHRNSQQAFLEQVRRCAPGRPARTDVSVQQAVADSAVLECVMASVGSKGSVVRLRYAD